MDVKGDELPIPKGQRRGPAASAAAIKRKQRDRNEAIAAAYATGAFSYPEIAEHFGLHLATVGRIIRGATQQSEIWPSALTLGGSPIGLRLCRR